jgi:hypothetical protein
MDEEGVILVDIMPQGQTINRDLYIQNLETLQKYFRRVQTQKFC